ncbi:MAG: hypothetical protein BMS9Abin11_1497 [Gammaproteobacteria bacterium]|nr:MAG: hypothetical protein BMS9Abin11_1497 [Gammaproteobacteria bacterium]
MKYASFLYDVKSMNLGDTIQTIAVEQFLPRVDKRYDRDSLGLVDDDEVHMVIMNGWFTTRPEYWPPSESILPVFFGFHINTQHIKRVPHYLLGEQSINYLKRYAPIGCRDRETARLLHERGVETYYSKCLSLTFPARETAPNHGNVFLVDVHDIPVPELIRANAIPLTHHVPQHYPDEIKIMIAKSLLGLYKNKARLVITDKLHCALPCIAFGIPVIFFGDKNETRISILSDLGLVINSKPPSLARNTLLLLQRLSDKFECNSFIGRCSRFLHIKLMDIFLNKDVDWEPEPLSIESEKEIIINNIKSVIVEKSG